MIRHTDKTIIFVISVLVFMAKYSEAVPETLPEVSLRPNIEYKAQDLKDPFQPPREEKKPEEEPKTEITPEVIPEIPLPSLEIQGLVWGGNLAQAIINKKIIRIGDMIEGARIIDINKEGIIISFNKREYNLPSPWIVNNLGALNNKQNFLQEVSHEK